MLAQYLHNAAPGHVSAAKHVLKYLIGTSQLGIEFSPHPSTKVEAFVEFPLPPSKIISLCDANWGLQDQSQPDPNKAEFLPLFKSRSISGFLIWMGGPLHWSSNSKVLQLAAPLKQRFTLTMNV